MSTIQLSDQLLNDIQEVLKKHDPATADIGIGIQYLAAVTGFLMASFPLDMNKKKDILDQLFQFANHVMNEHSQEAEGPAGTAPPADNNAFGVWKPE
jgi:hypothetical protein